MFQLTKEQYDSLIKDIEFYKEKFNKSQEKNEQILKNHRIEIKEIELNNNFVVFLLYRYKEEIDNIFTNHYNVLSSSYYFEDEVQKDISELSEKIFKDDIDYFLNLKLEKINRYIWRSTKELSIELIEDNIKNIIKSRLEDLNKGE